MCLFTGAGFKSYVTTLPGTELHNQWNSNVAKVGGRIYAILNDEGAAASIVFKCSEEAFEILTALPGAGQAPYFAKRRWVKVEEGIPLSGDELQARIHQSYRAVADGLSRTRRANLGL